MTWIIVSLAFAAQPPVTAFSPLFDGPVVVAQNKSGQGGGGDPTIVPSGEPAAGGDSAKSGDAPAEGDGPPPKEQQSGGPELPQMLLVMGGIFLFFWFFFIRPQNKQMKQHEELVSTLKKGDQVVTQGGMFGRIAGFDDSTGAVSLEIAKDVRVRVVRNQISRHQAAIKDEQKKE